ncbi:hypothetical protein A1O7_06659 [Cladophialophora yegresii CBS 114405]|uniref:Uncharacterized protein n=1 Tax=Cladophialophora yegresii CBS 114405 TaxID=1182544 RepID=W9VU04_9EURO|nr:uncharacterized protein A1O7_06659 [Cladophialophora yegresii CBS 114405]EXJ59227.1 hypothetical protein A1O7_06659 [Cladophialophora yegresii CBS 114405]
MDRQEALSSHAPLLSASTTQLPLETTRSTARLLFRSHWNLKSESAREEPRLRRLLGHISVYDRTKDFAQAQPVSTYTTTTEANSPATYVEHQVPSFEEFRAALKAQLETITQIRLAAAIQCNDVDEFDTDEESDCSYDSFDGDDWSDEDTSVDSDDSLTDNDSDGQISECTSPTSASANSKYDSEEDDGIWAIRPLTPFLNTSNRVASPS